MWTCGGCPDQQILGPSSQQHDINPAEVAPPSQTGVMPWRPMQPMLNAPDRVRCWALLVRRRSAVRSSVRVCVRLCDLALPQILAVRHVQGQGSGQPGTAPCLDPSVDVIYPLTIFL